MALKSYKDLQVWRKSVDLVEIVYQRSAGFPAEERYGLTAQLRRCIVSVPSNIAEGNARRSTADYARFISIALGSLAEMETQVEIAFRLGYLERSDLETIIGRSEEIGRMLRAIESKLRASLADRVTDSETCFTSPSSLSPLP